MEWLKEIWNQISSLLQWWIIILPWESGLRIRLGKTVKILSSGIHFRIPYVDSCYKQTIRIHFINLAPQTLTLKSKETLTISLIIGYSISDIFKVYNSVSEIQGVISGSVMGSISDFVSQAILDECHPSDIENHAKECLQKNDWGIEIKEIKTVSYAIVKTFRFIQDNAWMGQDHKLDNKI